MPTRPESIIPSSSNCCARVLRVPGQIPMIAKFPGKRSNISKRRNRHRKNQRPYLGLNKCAMANAVPKTMHIPATTTYAMPMKGFLPPITDRVDMRMDLVP